MKICDLFPSLAKYQIVDEDIQSDGVSNLITIHRRYKARRSLFGLGVDLSELSNKVMKETDGLKVSCEFSGWGDSDCKTFFVTIWVIPNGGTLLYINECKNFMRDEQE